MEVKLYQVDGKKYNVSADREQDFLANFPNAVLLGKIQGSPESATEESTQAQQQTQEQTQGQTQEEPQEESTSSGDSSSESGDLGSPEDYEPEALTIHHPIDFSDMITVVDKDEDEVVNAFLTSPQFPGIGVEKAGWGMGNAVNIQLPDGTTKKVDLRAFTDDGQSEAKAALDEVKQWYAENGDDPRVALGDILGRRESSSDKYVDFDNRELNSMNKALKNAGYYIEKHGAKYRLKHGLDYVTYENGREFWGTADQVQKYIWENVTEEELNGLKEYAKVKGEELQSRAQEKKESFYLDMTDEDSQPGLLNSGQMDAVYAAELHDAGVSEEDQANIQEFLDQKIVIEIESGGAYSPGGTRIGQGYSKVDGNSKRKRYEQLEQAIKSGEVQISEAAKDKVLSMLGEGGKLNLNTLSQEFPGEFNRYKQAQSSELASLWMEQQFKDDDDFAAIRSHFDGTTSKYTVEEEYEPFKQRGEKLKSEYENIKRTFDSEINAWKSDLEGSGLGVKVLGEGENMQIVVHGENENKRKAMQTRIDKILSNQKASQEKLMQAQSTYQTEFNSWINDNQESSFVSNAINKEFDTWTVLGEDFNNGFKDMVFGVGALFGSEGAMDALDASHAGQVGMETMLTWDQARTLGEEGRFAGRTVAQQGANTIVAIGSSALGLPPGAVQIGTAALFGASSGGQKRAELRNTVKQGEEAKLALDALEAKYADGTIDTLEYKRTKRQLEKTIQLGDLTPAQIEGAVWASAIIEGGVTYGLGTVPNALKFVDDFKGAGGRLGTLGDLVTRNNLQAARQATWEFGKRTGGEILEEELIYFGTELSDGLLTNREADFSGWDDVAVSSIIMAGPMNGAPILYNTTVSQMATAEIRAEYGNLIGNYTDLENKIAQLGTSPQDLATKRDLMNEQTDMLKKMGVVTAGMEVDALVTGSANIKELIGHSVNLQQLYQQAGIKPTDDQATKEKKLEDHKAALAKKSPVEAENFQTILDNTIKQIGRVQQETQLAIDESTIETLVQDKLGSKGMRIFNRMAQDEKFKKMTKREQLIAVHQQLKSDQRSQRIEMARNNDTIRKAVEQELYGGPFDESKKRGRNTKAEQELYDKFGQIWNVNQNSALKAFQGGQAAIDQITRIHGDIKDLKIVQPENEEELKAILEDAPMSDAQKAEALKSLSEGGTNGFIVDGKYIVVNGDQAAIDRIKSGKFLQGTVYTHEFMHALDDITLKQGENAILAENLAKQMTTDPALFKLHAQAIQRLQSIGEWDGSKPMSEQSEVAKNEYVKSIVDLLALDSNYAAMNVARKSRQGLGNWIRGRFGGDFNVNSPQAALNYVTGYVDSFNMGELSKEVQRKIAAKKKSGDTWSSKDMVEGESVLKSADGTDVTDFVNQLGAMDLESWKAVGADFALQVMQEQGMLDRLIAAKLKVPLSPAEVKDFISKVYAELANHVKNFNPEQNDSLFGWINSQIANKAGNVYNREYKSDPSSTVDIDATTSEGKSLYQLEADTDSAFDAIDDISLADMVLKTEEEVTEYSQLRQELELNGEMMDRVRAAVAKTFGTKLPDVNSKDFKKELQKQFRNELKKPIQDLMGGRKDYDNFLMENFPAVFRALPVETLVQMERNLDPSQRIFTESRRITKPTEVDRLISEGKLPKDTNRLSGPQLHTKKDLPSPEKILAFFRGKNMDAELGYKVGGSTLGTRKDKLAMELAVELAFDATSEVLQRPDVAERRASILEIQGMDRLENEVAIIGKAIDRDPNIMFSRDSVSGTLFFGSVSQNSIGVVNTMVEGLLAEIEVNPQLATDGPLMKKWLKDNMPEGDIQPTNDELNKITKKIAKYAKSFADVKEKSKDFAFADMSVAEFVKGELEQDYNDRNMTLLLSDVLPEGFTSITALYGDVKRINKGREQAKMVFERMQLPVEEGGMGMTREEAVYHAAMMGGMYARSSKIHDGSFMVNENGEVVPSNGERKVGSPRGQVFENVDDYMRKLGIKPEEWKQAKIEFQDKSWNAVNDMDYDGRLKQAEAARNIVMALMDSYMAGIEAGTLDYGDLAMLTKMFGSNMQSPMKRAANLAYVYVGYENDGLNAKNTGSKTEYEHIVPTNHKIRELVVSYMDNGKVEEGFWDNYEVAVIPKDMDRGLIASGYRDNMPAAWKPGDPATNRYYNNKTLGEYSVPIKHIKTGKIIGQEFSEINNLIREGGAKLNEQGAKAMERASMLYSKDADFTPVGMSAFDFDETLIIHGENFITATKGDQTIKISSDQWPIKGPALAQEGWDFDFSDFAQVRGGKEGPYLEKMRERIRDFGNKDVFVLTARQQEAAVPIHEWLKSKGIDIPLENITGLGDSRGEAKGEWMLNKFNEGYNDMYFVDDALPNVEAVQKVFDQFDIKGRTVQAQILFSKTASDTFNNMLEATKGMDATRKVSAAEASIIGRNKGRFRFFVPPSAEDFKGLLYNFLGKGKQGDADMAFFKEALLDPFAEGINQLESFRQRMSEDYAALKKAGKPVVKRFKKPIGVGNYTAEQAIRVWLWHANGIDIPGLSKSEIDAIVGRVNMDNDLLNFAMVLGRLSRQPAGYVKPDRHWTAGSIGMDLVNATKGARAQFLAQWKANADVIFSDENMNKIEAVYGTRFREALEDMLYRMENGTNRPKGQDREVNSFLNWINGSVATVMFFNTRSALLQTLSTVNFINFEDNNIFKAAKAFANQKQFWSDFAMLFNSDMLKQRRAGTKIDVSSSEISDIANSSGGKAEAIIAKLLDIGFTPTQIADSFAIAMGGSTFYRNRVNRYLKEGMTKADAERQAFLDFQEIAEETQQSSRPDLISKQQAGTLGRLILAWQNTPMQMTRLTKKALSDIVNGRGDLKSNISRVLYYGLMQNVLFGALQTGLMFTMFGDDQDEEEEKKKGQRIANGVLDSLLRGTGVYGAAVSTLKNVIMKWAEEHDKGFGRQDWSKVAQEVVNLSPPMGSKLRKVMNAIKTYEYNEDVIDKMDWSPNNPGWNVFGNILEAGANIPLARLMNKAANIEVAMQEGLEPWQRAALILGWSKWDVGVEDTELEEAKGAARDERDAERRARQNARTRCSAIKSNGEQCKNKTDNPNGLCYAHQ